MITDSYFKPWQRKIGVVMLLMACIFAVVAIRSLSIRDTINFKIGRYPVWLCSESSILCWASELESDPKSWGGFYSWEVDRLSDSNPFDAETLPDEMRLRWRMFGCATIPTGHNGICWMISDWRIIAAVTMLSACLLLSRPKRPKPSTKPAV